MLDAPAIPAPPLALVVQMTHLIDESASVDVVLVAVAVVAAGAPTGCALGRAVRARDLESAADRAVRRHESDVRYTSQSLVSRRASSSSSKRSPHAARYALL